MNRVFKKIILFAGILGLPAFFILVLKQGKPNYHPLPYFGKHEVIIKNVDGKENVDTLYYQVNNFSFTDENEQIISEKDYENKILLVNFLTLDCPNDNMQLCPMNFQEFKRYIYNEIVSNKGFEDVKILSHFLSKGDTASDMRLMYDHHGIDSNKWKFVKGSENNFFNAHLGLGNAWERKDSVYNNEREAYIFTLLIDKDRHIRGKYLTTMSNEIDRITKEISLLLREEKSTNE